MDNIISDATKFIYKVYEDLRPIPINELRAQQWIPEDEPKLLEMITKFNYDNPELPIKYVLLDTPGIIYLTKAILSTKLQSKMDPNFDINELKDSLKSDKPSVGTIIQTMLLTYKTYGEYKVYQFFDLIVVLNASNDHCVMKFKVDDTQKLRWFQRELLSEWMLRDEKFMDIQLDKYKELPNIPDPINKIIFCVEYDALIFLALQSSPMLSMLYIKEFINLVIRINNIPWYQGLDELVMYTKSTEFMNRLKAGASKLGYDASSITKHYT